MRAILCTLYFHVIIIIIIETFVSRLLQLKNEHKCYIRYGKIDKKIKATNKHYMLDEKCVVYY